MTSNTPKYNFTGRVALVTGSSSGIGRAIAIQLAQCSALLTITGRDRENLEKVGKIIEEMTGKIPLMIVGDLLNDDGDGSFVPQLVEKTIEKYGRLDILVNNAGGGSPNEAYENPLLMQQYDAVFGLNVKVPLQLTQVAVPFLAKTKGNVVNISSVASILPTMFVYSASKAALDMLTKTSAAQLAPKGIRVNSVNPGATSTRGGRFIGNEAHFSENAEKIKSKNALGRIAQPEDIANVVLFLASDDAVNMTGSIVVADAGKAVKTG